MDTKLTLFFETLREFFNFPTVGSKVGEETEEEQGVQVHQRHRVASNKQRLTMPPAFLACVSPQQHFHQKL
jgi:hypothetical protein